MELTDLFSAETIAAVQKAAIKPQIIQPNELGERFNALNSIADNGASTKNRDNEVNALKYTE